MEVSHESQSKHMTLTCTKTAPSAKFAYLPVENVIGLQGSISNQVKILQWGSTTELDTLCCPQNSAASTLQHGTQLLSPSSTLSFSPSLHPLPHPHLPPISTVTDGGGGGAWKLLYLGEEAPLLRKGKSFPAAARLLQQLGHNQGGL